MHMHYRYRCFIRHYQAHRGDRTFSSFYGLHSITLEFSELLLARRHLSSQPGDDYYGVLGVSPTATMHEIRSAFISKSKILHPDKNRGDVGMESKFKKLNEAYTTLSKKESRAEYDNKRIMHRNSAYRGSSFRGHQQDPFRQSDPRGTKHPFHNFDFENHWHRVHNEAELKMRQRAYEDNLRHARRRSANANSNEEFFQSVLGFMWTIAIAYLLVSVLSNAFGNKKKESQLYFFLKTSTPSSCAEVNFARKKLRERTKSNDKPTSLPINKLSSLSGNPTDKLEPFDENLPCLNYAPRPTINTKRIYMDQILEYRERTKGLSALQSLYNTHSEAEGAAKKFKARLRKRKMVDKHRFEEEKLASLPEISQLSRSSSSVDLSSSRSRTRSDRQGSY